MPILSNYENRKKTEFSNYIKRVEGMAQKRKAIHTTPQTSNHTYVHRAT